jgi:hypothetical protein
MIDTQGKPIGNATTTQPLNTTNGYGYEDLKNKLEKSGFNVSVTVPKTNPRHMINKPNNRKMYVGWIYAVNVLNTRSYTEEFLQGSLMKIWL